MTGMLGTRGVKDRVSDQTFDVSGHESVETLTRCLLGSNRTSIPGDKTVSPSSTYVENLQMSFPVCLPLHPILSTPRKRSSPTPFVSEMSTVLGASLSSQWGYRSPETGVEKWTDKGSGESPEVNSHKRRSFRRVRSLARPYPKDR